MRLPTGYGSVHKLTGPRRKPFRARKTIGWDDSGKQKYLTIGYYETRQLALQALALYNENPYTIDAKEITVKELHEKWRKEKYPKIAYKTTKVYDMCWNYCRDIQDLPFVEIKLKHLQDITDSMGNKWSAKKAFKILWHQMYDYAIKNDMNVKKYSTYIDIGAKTTKLERIPFDYNEIDTLWENVERMAFIDTILILIYTGMRVGEMLDIKIENVFIEKNYMIGGSKTKAGKNRVIPFNKKIVPLVQKWYDEAILNNSEYLIFNHEYKQMRYWNYYHEKWEKIIEQLKLNKDHKPHDTRHTFATFIDRTPANKLCVKRIMGHASKDLTERVYTHKDIEELIDTVNLLK